ncbi:MAG: hypothetical protein H6631_18780 [Anaerolineaceae bacterium]|nr:hypothetical protein [Anaerolineae bacterium]MCB9079655.1 hypothetical protein [Anaerolineaceae bacterium]
MNTYLKFGIHLFFLVLLTLLVNRPVAAQEPLFTPTDTVTITDNEPGVIRSRSVEINFELLGGPDVSDLAQPAAGSKVTLNLFEDERFVAVLDKIERNPSGSYSWIGHVENSEYSHVVFVIKQSVLIGTISTVDQSFNIGYHGGAQIISELDLTDLPDDNNDLLYPASPANNSLSQPSALASNAWVDDGSTIDIMVVYTTNARNGAGGTDKINGEIESAVSFTNAALARSGSSPRLRLVHTAEVNYAETGNKNIDLARLVNPNDGYMDQVHALRNRYSADVVSILIQYWEGGIAAHGNRYVTTRDDDYAFNLSSRAPESRYFTFAHEFGHLMGANHDWYVDDRPEPYPYSHGYVDLVGKVITLMAYYDRCKDNNTTCIKIPFYSNPALKYNGRPIGSIGPKPADNHRSINNTALTVANYRFSSTPPITGGPLQFDSYRLYNYPVQATTAYCGHVELYANLRNQSLATHTGVTAVISTDDPYITLQYNTDSAYPDLRPGNIDDNSYDFDFFIDPETPDDHIASFNLAISSNYGSWQDEFTVPTQCLENKVYLPLVVK